LYKHHHWLDATAEDKVAERQTAGLVGIVIILALLVCALFLVQRLHSAAVVEDCLMAGRHNCDALVTGAH
jgi:hypothetical protein